MAPAIISAGVLSLAFVPARHASMPANPPAALTRSIKRAAVLAMLFVTATFPEYAYAIDYQTVTNLFRDFVVWLFVDAGPYVFMAILGIVVVGIPKGWIPMKSGVIAVCTAFFFFMVPTIVRYAASSAGNNI
jgi:hypothetical protein